MLNRLNLSSRVLKQTCPTTSSPLAGMSRLESLPALAFDGIVSAPTGGTHVAVLIGQLSRTLRQQSFDASLHRLQVDITALQRAQTRPAQLLAQAQWLRLARDLQHLISMVNHDMGLRPMPSLWERCKSVIDAVRPWNDEHIISFPACAEQICEGIANLSQRDVLNAKEARAFRTHAAIPRHRERVLRLAQVALALRALGPDVLRRRLGSWAHSEQCRHQARADIAVERIVHVYATGADSLRLAALKLRSLPPCIEQLALLQRFDISYNPGVQARPSALISALPNLKSVSYSHWRETLRPGRTSRFLDLDDLDPPPQ